MNLDTHIRVSSLGIGKSSEMAMEEALHSATFHKSGGLVFSASHQTLYMYRSNQAGQLSNLQSLGFNQQEFCYFGVNVDFFLNSGCALLHAPP